MTALVTKHLPLVADAPDGIKKLRAFILDLAVRGKLVPQDSSDEPSLEILNRAELALTGRYVKRKTKGQPPESEDADPPYEVPRRWVWSRLGNIAEVIRGVTYSKSDAHEQPGPNLIPLLRGNNISDGKLNFDGPVFVPSSLVSADQYIRVGDIVIAMSSGSADLVGKAAQAEQEFHGAFGAFCGVVRPAISDLFPYFGFFFQTPFYRSNAAGRGKGIGINNLQKTALQSLYVPVPPLAEQHRIVAKVDELMALCDRLEADQADVEAAHAQLVQALLDSLTQATDAADFRASWQRLSEHFHTLFTTEASIDALKQTVLQLAVMGKLVQQSASDKPAKELLSRITEAKLRFDRVRATRELPSSPFPSLNAPPFQVPAGWLWTTFGAATICRDAERVPVSKVDREVRAKVYDYYGASGVIDKIDEYLFDKPLLLIGEDGANLINRSTPIAFIARGFYWVNNHAHVIDGISEVFLEYMSLYINAIDLKPYVTGTAQPKMNQAKLNSIPVPLPPEPEQRRIVAKVDELMALCDQLKAQLAEARTQRSRLADALVAQAVA